AVLQSLAPRATAQRSGARVSDQETALPEAGLRSRKYLPILVDNAVPPSRESTRHIPRFRATYRPPSGRPNKILSARHNPGAIEMIGGAGNHQGGGARSLANRHCAVSWHRLAAGIPGPGS